ncbi:hypothetical protein AB1Y20_001077 [Prymnesium parvum]|uniref:Uncharacterized protein n=1 Tax=Prymnesium parvum TaxID=97485 RepID=A0AB34KBJ8_PRYPA
MRRLEGCAAYVDEERVKRWAEQFQVFFRIPDHSSSEETLVEVAMPTREIESCWGIVPESLLTHADGISFRLPSFKAGAIDVGCVVKGQYPGGDAFSIKYHGSHCFARPPPPPVNFATCHTEQAHFSVIAEWSGGMQGRVTLQDSMWVRHRVVQLSFGEGGLQAGADVDRCYNAEFSGANEANGILSFTLPEKGMRQCGATDATGKAITDLEHQCFEFHIKQKPANTNRVKLLCPANYPSPPPPMVSSPPPPPMPVRV